MSHNRIRVRSERKFTAEEVCRSKRRFRSRKLALTAKNAEPRTRGMVVYHCRVCHGWHIASKPGYDPCSS